MMKNLILACVVFFLSGNLIAQEFDLGIKGGANFSKINGIGDLENRNTFSVGVFSSIKLSAKLAVQGDLLYSDQGGEASDRDFNLTYINVPIVLKYYFVENLNIHTGAQFGVLIFDSFAKDSENVVESNPTDLSGVVGVGYDFPLGIRVEVRHNFGLSEVLKHHPPVQYYNSKGRNAVWAISLGYSFL